MRTGSLIEQVENEIQAVISGVKPPEEATTAVAGKNSSKIDKIDQKAVMFIQRAMPF